MSRPVRTAATSFRINGGGVLVAPTGTVVVHAGAEAGEVPIFPSELLGGLLARGKGSFVSFPGALLLTPSLGENFLRWSVSSHPSLPGHHTAPTGSLYGEGGPRGGTSGGLRPPVGLQRHLLAGPAHWLRVCPDRANEAPGALRLTRSTWPPPARAAAPGWSTPSSRSSRSAGHRRSGRGTRLSPGGRSRCCRCAPPGSGTRAGSG